MPTSAEDFFVKLIEEMPELKLGKMFGALCMKAPNGKSAAMFWKDNIVVKLQADAFKAALSLDGAALFEPMEGKPMKEWVQIPFTYKNQWKQFALTSYDLVKLLEKKAPKKRS